ncbi:MAG TPA: sulfate/thiosulfate ABC transporter permease CysW, partial [Bacilli bacterium]
MRNSHITEPTCVKWILISIALLFLGFLLVLPLITVLVESLSKGVGVYYAAITDPEALSAIRLTLITAVVAVALNTLFGLAAAWAITKFRFVGKNILITLIDLPFAVSPVIAGLVFVLLFGAQGLFGPWLQEHDIQIIFAVPG